MGKTTAVDGTALNPSDYAIPCGYFEGMFPVSSISVAYSNGTALPVAT